MTTRPVRIVTDSAADIPADLSRELDITSVSLLVNMGDHTYRDGVEITGEEFYRRLRESKSVTTTSLATLDSLSDAYRKLTGDGYAVLSIHLSSKHSGTFNAALMASTAAGVMPEAVEVLDSRTLSMAQGWIAERAARTAAEGHSLEEVTSYAERLVPRARLYGLLESLEYVVRSGPVNRLPGTVGNMLNIRPILTIRPNGEALIHEKVRTRQKALERIVRPTAELGPLESVAVLHGDYEEGAARLAEMLGAINPPRPLLVTHIGAVLGTHLGPYAVGICCITQ
jgi:DegV family protein with EDD domain